MLSEILASWIVVLRQGFWYWFYDEVFSYVFAVFLSGVLVRAFAECFFVWCVFLNVWFCFMGVFFSLEGGGVIWGVSEPGNGNVLLGKSAVASAGIPLAEK